MTEQTKPQPSKKELKKSIKKLRFWADVLLASDLMDDVEHRKELINSIHQLEILKKRAS